MKEKLNNVTKSEEHLQKENENLNVTLKETENKMLELNNQIVTLKEFEVSFCAFFLLVTQNFPPEFIPKHFYGNDICLIPRHEWNLGRSHCLL